MSLRHGQLCKSEVINPAFSNQLLPHRSFLGHLCHYERFSLLDRVQIPLNHIWHHVVLLLILLLVLLRVGKERPVGKWHDVLIVMVHGWARLPVPMRQEVGLGLLLCQWVQVAVAWVLLHHTFFFLSLNQIQINFLLNSNHRKY